MPSTNDFQTTLTTYINIGGRTKKDYLFACVPMRSVFVENVSYVISAYHASIPDLPKPANILKSFLVETYNGKNPFVLRMMQYLSRSLNNDLAGAFVHGSLATYEEIPYSDFDALVIIKNEVFSDAGRLANTAYLLNRALQIMFTHDPLQHHGWFVMTERDLQNYEGVPLPVAVFPHMKSLLPDKNLLHISFKKNSHVSRELFDSLSATIMSKLQTGQYPRNLYDLKSLLSQFMLLPTAYVQARDGQGIFKRESFTEAAKDFTHDEWKVMHDVSTIRKNWDYTMDRFSKVLTVSTCLLLRSYLLRFFTRNIPSRLRVSCGKQLYSEMLDFTFLMKAKLASQLHAKGQE